MDKITIKEAVYPCTLGITEEEQAQKQTVILDIVLFFDIKKAGISDSIYDTINYSEINKQLNKLIGSKPFCLIEKIADEVAQYILRTYPANKVEVIVKKPCALRNANHASVGILREKILYNNSCFP